LLSPSRIDSDASAAMAAMTSHAFPICTGMVLKSPAVIAKMHGLRQSVLKNETIDTLHDTL
jgi:hypothetical protein